MNGRVWEAGCCPSITVGLLGQTMSWSDLCFCQQLSASAVIKVWSLTADDLGLRGKKDRGLNDALNGLNL